jgi:hypothetical protein
MAKGTARYAQPLDQCVVMIAEKYEINRYMLEVLCVLRFVVEHGKGTIPDDWYSRCEQMLYKHEMGYPLVPARVFVQLQLEDGSPTE